MKIPSQCPMCGSTAWQCVNIYRTGFSFGKSFLAAMFLGRETGMWFGLLGKRRKVYGCQSCRFIMEYEK